jgi:hypothetical protein
MKEVVLIQVKCKRCGHEWFIRHPQLPKVCAKCTSRYWNTDYPPNVVEYKGGMFVPFCGLCGAKLVNNGCRLNSSREKVQRFKCLSCGYQPSITNQNIHLAPVEIAADEYTLPLEADREEEVNNGV